MPQQVAFPIISSDTFCLECEMRYLGSEELQPLPRRRSWGPQPGCASLVGTRCPAPAAEQVKETPSLRLFNPLPPQAAAQKALCPCCSPSAAGALRRQVVLDQSIKWNFKKRASGQLEHLIFLSSQQGRSQEIIFIFHELEGIPCNLALPSFPQPPTCWLGKHLTYNLSTR